MVYVSTVSSKPNFIAYIIIIIVIITTTTAATRTTPTLTTTAIKITSKSKVKGKNLKYFRVSFYKIIN